MVGDWIVDLNGFLLNGTFIQGTLNAENSMINGYGIRFYNALCIFSTPLPQKRSYVVNICKYAIHGTYMI